MHRIPFNTHQREDLLRLGIAAKAIDHIEIEGLPIARRFLTHPPRNADVLGELNGLHGKLTGARNAIERLLDAREADPPLKAAQTQIAASLGRHSLGGLRLNETSKSLATAIDLVALGIAQVSPEPLRHRSANPYVIKLIHEALQHGSIAASGDLSCSGPAPSASPNSVFRRVIGICYEAIDAENPDPERALKAYMNEWRALEEHFESVGLGTERPQKT